MSISLEKRMKKEIAERIKGFQDKDFGSPELQREVINLLEFL